MIINKVYKYPIKLTDTQKSILYRWSCACRYLWNRSLRLRERLYKKYKVSINYTGCTDSNKIRTTNGLNKRLTTLRNRYDWLAEVPNCCQQEVLRDMDKAYSAFFRRLKLGEGEYGYPKTKKKFMLPRLYFPKSRIIFNYVENKVAYIKISKLGMIRIIYDRPAIENEKDEIVSCSLVTERNKWFLCLLVKKEIPDVVINPNKQAVGIDAGIVKTYTLSDGTIYNINIDKIKELQKRKSILQKRLSRKVGSKKFETKSSKWLKLKKTIDKIDHKISDIRENFNHEISKEVANNYSLVAIEKLKIKNMSKSAKGTIDKHGKNVKQKSSLNKSILNQGWGQFKVFLQYKCDHNNVKVVEVDPKYTSQTCSVCGYVDKENRKSQSVFVCKQCGHSENADLNASKNILKSVVS